MTPMTPERKTEIARANGAKSRGPKTPEGKAVSSMNALRHGLTASRPLLPGESQESFEELLKEYMEEYEPDGPAEIDLVHRMVVSKWREQRAWTVETAALSSHMPARRGKNSPPAPPPISRRHSLRTPAIPASSTASIARRTLSLAASIALSIVSSSCRNAATPSLLAKFRSNGLTGARPNLKPHHQ